MCKLLPLLIVPLVLLVGCSRQASDSGGGEEVATPVEVATAVRGSIHHLITAGAILYPANQATIVPKITAPVARFLVNRGDHVTKGELLAVLEDRDLVAAAQESKELYAQAQASYQTTARATMPEDLTKAQSDAESARQALDAAKSVYESRQSLFRQGAIARRLVDEAKVALVQAQSQFDTAQEHLSVVRSVNRTEQLKSAQAQMDAAKAHYDSAAAQVSYAEIRSPINGVVADRPIYVGEMASSSSALISIVDISHLIARANVPVGEASAVHIGDQATISGNGGELTGKVTVVSPAVDPSTTTVEIWVEASNRDERLRPGTTARISIDAGELKNVVLVPPAALLSNDQGGNKVMVAGADSLAHERDVDVGLREDNQVQIVHGVSAGEKVIVEGGLGLEDKAKIAIQAPGAKENSGNKDQGKKDGTD